MQQDASAVGDLVDQVHSGAGDLHPTGEGRLVDLEPVVALAAERGDQGRVDVDDPLRPLLDEVLGQDGQKARQEDEVRLVFPELFQQAGFKVRLAQLLPGHGEAGHAVVFGPLQGVGPGGTGEHHHDLPVGDLPALLGLEQGLQIGAAAGDQDGNARLAQHSTTRSSPETISPAA